MNISLKDIILDKNSYHNMNNIYPLAFSIPIESFQAITRDKKKSMAPLIPGKLNTYIYKTQETYYKMYNQSIFGKTWKKEGWDCLRHYEIIACGCFPYFPSLEDCPDKTMFNFPKKLIIDVNKLYDDGNLTYGDYYKYLDELVSYAKKNLTCKASAEYILSTLSKINNDFREFKNLKILLVGCTQGVNYVNYSRDLLTIGLRKLLGKNLIDYPKNIYLYKGNKIPISKLHGNGFTYSNVLEDNENIDRDNISKRIDNKEFDYIIFGATCVDIGMYGDIRRNMNLWGKVSENYDKNHIVFIYGGDRLYEKKSPYFEHLLHHSENGICFVRELNI